VKIKSKIIHRAMLIGLLVMLSAGYAIRESVSAREAARVVPSRALTHPGTTPFLIEQARKLGTLDTATADLYLAYAFYDYEKLPKDYRSQEPWHGTLTHKRLVEENALAPAGPSRTTISNLLTGNCGGYSGGASIGNSTNFHVEYNSISGGLTITDYIDSLETAWTSQITTFGWAAPPVSGSNPPPGSRYHVRIEGLGGGLYGFVTTSGTHTQNVGNNPNTAWNDVDAWASCMVLNSNYSGFASPAQESLDATTAHEFHHSIQFGYGAITGANAADNVFVEGGASWVEDEVFDYSNDNYYFLWPSFTACMGSYSGSPYPYWVVFRAMSEPHGTGTAGAGEQVYQDFWEEISQSGSAIELDALNTALTNKGTNLPDAFHNAAIANRFNISCGGGYVLPYCLEEGPGYVSVSGAPPIQGTINSVGSSYNGSLPDNYSMEWINLPTSGGPYDVTLTNNNGSGGELRGSVVCNTGSEFQVHAMPGVVGPSSSTTLSNFDPSGCTTVSAILTNQSQTAASPNSCSNRSFTVDTDASTGPSPTPSDTPTPTLTPLPTMTSSPTVSPTASSSPTPTETPAPAIWFPLVIED
jgi:hypothetical protein